MRINELTVKCEGEQFHSTHLLSYEDEWFWINLFGFVALTAIAGYISGLTLALLSLDRLDLEVLQNVGSEKEKKMARKIMPLVRRRHLLLVTLVLGNAACVTA